MTRVMDVSVSPLAGVLNDSGVSYIGDPYRNTHYVRINITDLDSSEIVRRQLDRLEVAYTETRPGERIYLMVYDLESQRRLLEAVGPELSESRRGKLDVLVRARGPIPAKQLQQMRFTAQIHSPAQAAHDLNQKGVVEGMGGYRWNAKKVQRALLR